MSSKPNDDDEFDWSGVADVIFDADQWASADWEVDSLLDWVDVSPGGRVLDMACGPGRHAVQLAERGYRVTGVDLTEAFLREARRRADEAGVDVEWICEDMREFSRPDRYELGLLLYASLGLFEAPEDDRLALRRMHRTLEPGAEFVVEVTGKELVAGGFEEEARRQIDDGRECRVERRLEGNWERLMNRWTIVDEAGRQRTHELSFRLFSAVELDELLRRVGFERVRIFGGFDGRDYGREANRLIAVAEAGDEAPST